MAEWVLKGSLKGPQGDPGSDATVTVDSSLSADSENPVQNKVVKAALDEKLEVAELAGTPVITKDGAPLGSVIFYDSDTVGEVPLKKYAAVGLSSTSSRLDVVSGSSRIGASAGGTESKLSVNFGGKEFVARANSFGALIGINSKFVTSITDDASSGSADALTTAKAVKDYADGVGVPTGGTAGQVLTKTSGGEAWADVPQPDISDVPRLDSGKMKSLHQLGITDLDNVTEPGTYVGASGLGGYPTISNLPDGFLNTESGAISVFYIDVYRFDTPDDMGLSANWLIQKLYPMYEGGVGRAYIRRGKMFEAAEWSGWFGIGVPPVDVNAEVGSVLTVGGNMNLVWDLPPQPDIPLPVSQGGTGATTAEGARTALGIPDIEVATDEEFDSYMGLS